MEKLKSTEEFYRELESMNWFKRLFFWGKLLTLSRKSYSEIERIADSEKSLIELRTKLEASQKEVRKLEGELGELKGEKKSLDEELKKNLSKVGQLEKADNKNIEEISDLKSKIEVLNQRNSDYLNDKKELEKKITSIEKELDQKRKDYDKQVEKVETLQESLTKQIQKLNDERVLDEKKKFEEMKKTWKAHESLVENEVKKICERNVLEYIDKSSFSTKKKPDNIIKVLDEFVIFDAKSPANDNLDNFQNDIINQAKDISKYLSEKNVKRDLFLVVPTNTLEVLTERYFDMGEYRVYVITKEAIEPIIKSFKKIEEYENIQEFSPEDRERICQVIGRFAHSTKRRVQIDAYLAKEFTEIWKKIGDLPEEVVEKVEEFEMSGNLLNPPVEQRKKKISVVALDKERRNFEKELEFVGVNPKIEKKDIDVIELYKKEESN